MANNDTIIAVSTPVGESAIGVIRLSGNKAISLCSKVVNNSKSLEVQKSHTIRYHTIINPETLMIIDKVLISVFKSPKTFTGEDIAEISCHGSPLIIKEIIDLFLKLGARPANPGEFTQRAYLNGKMDLTQAEAVNDLIRAHTRFAQISALNQVSGKFSDKINDINSELVDLLADIEVSIDHSDLEEKFISYEIIQNRISKIRKDIISLTETSTAGKITREGINISIVGAPNTGKSSLMNYLLRQDRVIVSEIPGTTRDIVEDELNIRGISVKIFDTAGIRETNDIIENKGIERTKNAIIKSDLIIMLFDASRNISSEDKHIFNLLKKLKCIFVLNKIDLPSSINDKTLFERFGIHTIPISIVQKKGIEAIERAIEEYYYSFGYDPAKDLLVTNARQENLLRNADESLVKAISAISNNLSEEFIASSVRKAKSFIEEITGRNTGEEVLDIIFSRFCIGK